MNEITDLKKLNIDKTWSLFLDRDGVINKRLIDDYVKSIDEFEFLLGVPEAFKKFSDVFGRIFVITNQRGIAREIMTENDLETVHNFMIDGIKNSGGRVDKIYFCPHDRDENCGCRKPDIGSALKAQQDFPEIDFKKSIMVGDTSPDIEFGKNAGMFTIKITTKDSGVFSVSSLAELADLL
jgi:D-glycero-D-manno-heptose 1,7-bisphosphate phosphatase